MSFRSTLWFLAKLAFAVAVVWWLLNKVDAAEVWSLVRAARFSPVAFGVVIGVLMIALAAWRWMKLLGVFGISLPWRQLFCINWVGQFFMMFLPGPSGDDLTRMLYISRLAKGRVGLACSTVLVDRCIGLASVFILALFCLPVQWQLLASNTQTQWLAIVVLIGAIGVAGAGVLFLLGSRDDSALVRRLLHLLPAGKVRTTLDDSWSLLRANKLVLCQVFGAALLTQLLNCGAFYCAGLAVGVTASFAAWSSFVPVVLAANILPITLAGLGVREYLLVLFLGVVAGTAPEQALAASAIAFGMMLFVSLAGGGVYLFFRVKAPS
jgi:uncharacterized membrane protein YbhN (UPF0104 family)